MGVIKARSSVAAEGSTLQLATYRVKGKAARRTSAMPSGELFVNDNLNGF